ncbi:MAG: glycosyltransferase family 4 protein [bacterium]|nr:glycosyltransferase family 4 protein [bacterium]
MRLLIISNMSHYRRGEETVGWGPTVQEIDHLASLFDSIHHIACLHDEPAPSSSLPYATANVTLTLLPPAGGQHLVDKLGILRLSPRYLRAIWRGLRNADVVHVRCPANIPLLALLLLVVVRRPRTRWVKYGGNWRPRRSEAWTSSLQRRLLRRGVHRGWVTVNGRWSDDPPHVRSFFNPCLERSELASARESTAEKALCTPVKLLYVGRIEHPKGLHELLQIAARLERHGVAFRLDLVGDGPERPGYEALARELGVAERLRFHGWQPRTSLGAFYREAHFFLLPSHSEGWPKVLGESMAYGVVPLASAIASIPQILEECRTGRALPHTDVDAFARAIEGYLTDPKTWKAESLAGTEAADRFTYEHYLGAVRSLVGLDQASAVLEANSQ